jgi:hypothetical protein
MKEMFRNFGAFYQSTQRHISGEKQQWNYMLRTWLVFGFSNFCYLHPSERDTGGLKDNGRDAPRAKQLRTQIYFIRVCL